MKQYKAQTSAVSTVLLCVSVLAWSMAGLFTRAIALDAASLLFWRGALGAAFMLMPMIGLVSGKQKTMSLQLGWAELSTIVLTTVGAISTIAALRLAPVANVVCIFATTPIVATILSYAALRTPISSRTVVACVLVVLGSVLIVRPTEGVYAFGSLVAFGVPLSVALGIVVIRGAKRFSIVLNTLLCSLALAICFAPFAQIHLLSSRELILLSAFAITQTCIGGVLFAFASRSVDPTANALIQLLDIPLSIAWVWIGFDETPSYSTIAGGAIIVIAVVWYQKLSVGGLRLLSSALLANDH